MIEMGKSYRTRDGREVRIYATDGGGLFPVHGAVWEADGSKWVQNTWVCDGRNFSDGAPSAKDLIPSDPHGILPRHRELLASVYEEMDYPNAANGLREMVLSFGAMRYDLQAALIALAKLDNERGAA